MRVKGVLIAFILLLALNVASASENFVVIGKYPDGNSYAVEYYNGYLIMSSGSKVRIYNYTGLHGNEANITFQTPYAYVDIGSMIRDFYVDSNYLYVASEQYLVIVDITDPSDPVKLGVYENPSTTYEFRGVVVSNDYAYLATRGQGVLVVNVTNKSNLVLETSFAVGTYNKSEALFVNGSYLYVAEWDDDEFSIYNISIPSSPTFVGNWTAGHTNGDFSDIIVVDNYVYVAEYYERIFVVNISNPASPVLVWNSSEAYGDFNVNKLFRVGNYLYCSVRYDIPYVFDITDRANPTKVSAGSIGSEATGYSEQIAATTDRIFVSMLADGLHIYNSSDLNNITYLTHIPVVGDVYSMSVSPSASYMYVGTRDDHIYVFNITDATNIYPTKHFDLDGRYSAMVGDTDYLYVAGEWEGLTIFNISDEGNPTIVLSGWEPPSGNPGEAMIIDGNYLYVGIENSSGRFFGVINVSDKTSPVEVSVTNLDPSLSDMGIFYDIEKYNSTVVIVATANGLYFIDVSNKVSPSLITKLDGSWHTLYYKNGILYATNNTLLMSLNVTDLNNIYIIDYVETDTSGYDSVVLDDVFYSVDGSLYAFDISHPDYLLLINTTDLGTTTSKAITGYGTHIFVGSTIGIIVYQNVSASVTPPDVIDDEVLVFNHTTSTPEYICLLYTSPSPRDRG